MAEGNNRMDYPSPQMMQAQQVPPQGNQYIRPPPPPFPQVMPHPTGPLFHPLLMMPGNVNFPQNWPQRRPHPMMYLQPENPQGIPMESQWEHSGYPNGERWPPNPQFSSGASVVSSDLSPSSLGPMSPSTPGLMSPSTPDPLSPNPINPGMIELLAEVIAVVHNHAYPGPNIPGPVQNNSSPDQDNQLSTRQPAMTGPPQGMPGPSAGGAMEGDQVQQPPLESPISPPMSQRGEGSVHSEENHPPAPPSSPMMVPMAVSSISFQSISDDNKSPESWVWPISHDSADNKSPESWVRPISQVSQSTVSDPQMPSSPDNTAEDSPGEGPSNREAPPQPHRSPRGTRAQSTRAAVPDGSPAPANRRELVALPLSLLRNPSNRMELAAMPITTFRQFQAEAAARMVAELSTIRTREKRRQAAARLRRRRRVRREQQRHQAQQEEHRRQEITVVRVENRMLRMEVRRLNRLVENSTEQLGAYQRLRRMRQPDV